MRRRAHSKPQKENIYSPNTNTMNIKYFYDCHSLEDVKRKYKELAMLHHPDRGGNTATMQEINNEYEEIQKNPLFDFAKQSEEDQEETADERFGEGVDGADQSAGDRESRDCASGNAGAVGPDAGARVFADRGSADAPSAIITVPASFSP